MEIAVQAVEHRVCFWKRPAANGALPVLDAAFQRFQASPVPGLTTLIVGPLFVELAAICPEQTGIPNAESIEPNPYRAEELVCALEFTLCQIPVWHLFWSARLLLLLVSK
jgi:hypothetical protein